MPGALDALGIDYTIAGNEAKALCPAHADRSPSWSCNVDTGQHNCFSCGFSGSFAKLVAHLNKSWDNGRVDEWITQRKLRDITEGYKPARDRKIEKAQQISAADMWNFVEPPFPARRVRDVTKEACRAYGVQWNPNNQTWIFPIKDPQQDFKIIGWQEKGEGLFRNHPRHLEKGKTLFGLERHYLSKRAIVVESPIDAVRFSTYGHDVAVATYGATWTQTQADLLLGYFDDIVLAFDNDAAGVIAATTMARALHSHCKIFAYGEPVREGMKYWHPGTDSRDPGDLLEEELRDGLRWATPAWRTGYDD